MSEEEMVIFVFSLGIAICMWVLWYARIHAVTRMASRQSNRCSLYVTPAIAAVALFSVLRAYASHDVRNDSLYLVFYMVMGAAWVGLTVRVMPFLGISARDDVAERANVAAGYAVSGGLVGLAFAFAGANIGDGPGWWVVVFCAGLSTIGFYIVWALIEVFARVSEAITVDRDEASGIRLSGYLIASGLVLGRGAAGDWETGHEAFLDLLNISWPLLFLVAIAVGLERMLRPTPQLPKRSLSLAGIFVAVLTVAGALLYLSSLGPW